MIISQMQYHLQLSTEKQNFRSKFSHFIFNHYRFNFNFSETPFARAPALR